MPLQPLNMIDIEAEQIEELAKTLDTIASYLIKVRELTKSRKNNLSLVFAWDWEMLHEIVYEEETRSVFSTLLLYGLQCLRECKTDDDEYRILIPEGTRRELLRDLKRLVNDLRKTGSVIDAATGGGRNNPLKTRVPLFAGNSDWQDVLKALSVFSYTEHRIERLLMVLDTFAIPSPLPAARIPNEKVRYYLQQMDRSRPRHKYKQRNEADAYNLAMVDELSDIAARKNRGPAVALSECDYGRTGATLQYAHPSGDREFSLTRGTVAKCHIARQYQPIPVKSRKYAEGLQPRGNPGS
jgi:hypothetical protein